MVQDENTRKAEQIIKKARLAGATSINLRAFNLTEIPESLGNLTQLQQLDLSNNQLTNLPEWLGSFTQLQDLYLSNNQLTNLPEWLGSLTQLQFLDLSSNQLTNLPESLGNLTQLPNLYLSNNYLTELPESLGNLTQLHLLDLSDNQLTNLPESLGNLAQLQNLILLNNQLTDLPESLGNLTQLRYLDFRDNPLNPLIRAVCEQGIQTLLQFFREQANDKVILHEAKLVLVGEGEVGKSSLLAALRGEQFIEGRDTTHGVEIKCISLTNPDTEDTLTLNGWDFGGQPIYRPTHQLFFSEAAIYLVVWKPREGPEQGFVEYWTNLIKHRAFDEKRPHQRPRVLIVATHGGPKERQAFLDEEALRKRFPDFIVDFSHVDSQTGDQIKELKQAIARTASGLPDVGRPYPGRWQRIREILARQSKPYLLFTELKEICYGQGLSNEQTNLFITICHTLGQLIYYNQDEGLKDIVILKPDWLTKAISFVLEDKQIKEQYGLIQHSRLRELWNDPARNKEERYSPELHPIFLRLMERFDVSYRVILPDPANHTSLIAQLVPGARPERFAEDWNERPTSGDKEQVQVCRIVDASTGINAPAEGLFYQLIVRLHRYSLGREDYRKSCHWQQGLVLEDGYNGRAFLVLEGGDIRITVRAAYPIVFLNQLSSEVKWLVENFWKGLRCQIMVPCRGPCGVDDPGRGLFEIEKLIESRRKSRSDYPCSIPGCNQWQNIDELMVNISQPNSDVASHQNQQTAEIIQAIQQGIQPILVEVQTSRIEVQAFMSKADEHYAAVMTTLLDEGRDGPRLISWTPVDPGFWDRPGWMSQKIRLTLWCEHSRLPLPILWGDKRGVYEFDQPREWLVKVAPYVRLVTGALSLVLPVAASAAKLVVDDSYKQQLEFSEKSTKALLDVGGQAGEWLGHDDRPGLSGERTMEFETPEYQRQFGQPTPTYGGMLRELEHLLRTKDPGFGGLVRVQNNRREFLWIHPNYEKEYNPGLPQIP
ncbi:COR domain-containing protein [Candidatus Cyanaurora vandensis]|uniref:COR domain-containing protein n=2 Tax=Candidatus Cyanaurora vandensis TaxID=2714958 RepID=UPI00257D5F69|nr:COR domain-containing protein [Candidatus Cyanaurora vandensis]